MSIDKITNAPTPNEQIDKINELIDDTNTNSSNISTISNNITTINNTLSSKENSSNKVNSITNTTSTTLYPSNKAVVDYVSQVASGGVPTGAVISSVAPHSMELSGYIQADGRVINNTDYANLYSLGKNIIENYPESITIYDNYKDAYDVNKSLGPGLRTARNGDIFGPMGNKTYRYITCSDDIIYAFDQMPKKDSITAKFSFILKTPDTIVTSTYFFGTSKRYQGIILGFNNTSGQLKLYMGSTQNTSSWDCANAVALTGNLSPATEYIVSITLLTSYNGNTPNTTTIRIRVSTNNQSNTTVVDYTNTYAKAYFVPVFLSDAYFLMGGYGSEGCNCYIRNMSASVTHSNEAPFVWKPYRQYHGSPATNLLAQKYGSHSSFKSTDFIDYSYAYPRVTYKNEIYKITTAHLNGVSSVTDEVYILDPFKYTSDNIDHTIVYSKNGISDYCPCGVITHYKYQGSSSSTGKTYLCRFYRYDLQQRWVANIYQSGSSAAVAEPINNQLLYVPKLDNIYLTQDGDVTSYGGRTIQPGLPAIEGSAHGADGIASTGKGVFYDYGSISGNAGDGTDRLIGFSASGSNQIYGSSETVRPLSARMWYWIKT